MRDEGGGEPGLIELLLYILCQTRGKEKLAKSDLMPVSQVGKQKLR